jgi:hypothetical protein
MRSKSSARDADQTASEASSQATCPSKLCREQAARMDTWLRSRLGIEPMTYGVRESPDGAGYDG